MALLRLPRLSHHSQLDDDNDDVTVFWNTTDSKGIKVTGSGKEITIGGGKGDTTVFVCADDKDPSTKGQCAWSCPEVGAVAHTPAQ
jgi:hypothetical protein